jgi:FMN phosphatase YigB (HAD superfamily)
VEDASAAEEGTSMGLPGVMSHFERRAGAAFTGARERASQYRRGSGASPDACGRLRGVIFDLDGTLYTLEGVKVRMTLALWSSVGVLRHLSSTRAALRPRDFESGEALSHAFYAELGRRAGLSTEAAREWYESQFLTAFVDLLSKSARPRPNLLALLSRLREGGARLAVVSDFGHIPERLEALGIPASAFDDLLAADDLGALKPSPRPLLRVAEGWGLRPDALIMVGDRLDLDAASAAAAGMEFLGVHGGALSRSKGPGFVSWTEASRLLEARTAARSN